jgi:hypothetical protein
MCHEAGLSREQIQIQYPDSLDDAYEHSLFTSLDKMILIIVKFFLVTLS